MDLISLIEQIPLSGTDLTQMARSLGNPHVKAILYSELAGLTDINQLFNDANSVFILFEIQGELKPSVGHWIVLIKHGGLSYYDPYALMLSQDLQLTGEPPWLELLLSKVPTVEMNRHRHQLLKDETQTCGRHTVVRSLFWFMDNERYHRHIIQPILPFVKDPDTFVTLMTAFLGPSDRVLRELNSTSLYR